jgi:hypothetical protein
MNGVRLIAFCLDSRRGGKIRSACPSPSSRASFRAEWRANRCRCLGHSVDCPICRNQSERLQCTQSAEAELLVALRVSKGPPLPLAQSPQTTARPVISSFIPHQLVPCLHSGIGRQARSAGQHLAAKLRGPKQRPLEELMAERIRAVASRYMSSTQTFSGNDRGIR